MSDYYEMEISKLTDWNEDLEQENKLLREALEEIIKIRNSSGKQLFKFGRAYNFAKEALEAIK